MDALFGTALKASDTKAIMIEKRRLNTICKKKKKRYIHYENWKQSNEKQKKKMYLVGLFFQF